MITNGMQRLIAFVVTATLVLAACGGGSGNNMAGIDRTGAPVIASYGTVTAFGSVVVNGVHYNTSGTMFTINGDAGAQSDLGIGDVVLVKGTLDSGGATGVAASVRFDNNVVGPIVSIDATANTFVVLGQVIRVSADTSFDGTIQPPALATLTPGDIVEVSGLVQGDGSVNATRIGRRPVGGEYAVSGTVEVNQSAQRIFLLNTQIVDYQSAQLRGIPGNTVGNGQHVLVRGSLVNGVLHATRVEYLGNALSGASGDRREVEGVITRFASATDFDASDLTVTTNSQTSFDGGSATDLALNVKVEIEGTLNGAGVLEASKIEVRRSAPLRIVAQVDSISATANSFVILGLTVKVDALTRLEDQSSQQARPFSLANLAASDYVEVRGTESPAGSGQLLATLVQRNNLQPDAVVQGFVQSVTPPQTFVVFGVNIGTNNSTQFNGLGGVAALAVGDLVKVTGQNLGDRAMTAREVERDD
jgi:hypothetical protein